VRAFVRQGGKSCFFDIAADVSNKLVGDIAADNGNAPTFVQADVTGIDMLKAAIASVEAQFGAINILVNNAASDTRHEFDSVTADYWDQRMAVNLRHQFFAAETVRKGMAAAGGGAIINMGSCAWYLGLGDMPVYLIAKAGIAGLTRALATEMGPDKIRVNCIVPGFVKIDRTIRDFITPEFEKMILDGQCLPDLVIGADIAAMGLFLASDDARHCTNQNYVVDGGWI
jgi:D-xylose 1-dehydrogenase